MTTYPINQRTFQWDSLHLVYNSFFVPLAIQNDINVKSVLIRSHHTVYFRLVKHHSRFCRNVVRGGGGLMITGGGRKHYSGFLKVRDVYFSPPPPGGRQKYELMSGWGKNMIYLSLKKKREY